MIFNTSGATWRNATFCYENAIQFATKENTLLPRLNLSVYKHNSHV